MLNLLTQLDPIRRPADVKNIVVNDHRTAVVKAAISPVNGMEQYTGFSLYAKLEIDRML